MNRIVTYVLIGLFFTSCIKDPDFSTEPRITFSSISRYEFIDFNTQSTEEFVDITLLFQDGDGDLGEPSSSNGNNLRYQTYRRTKGKDSLIVDWIEFRFNDLAPESSYVGPLSGDFTHSIKYLDTDTTFNKSDTIFYKILIKDRAGNVSNTEQTSAVIIFPN